MVKVTNLATLGVREYTCTPEEAVIAAYAQERGDWNTWGYRGKYGGKVIRGRRAVACGDWAAMAQDA